MDKRARPYRVVNSECHQIGRIKVVKDTIEINGHRHPYTYIVQGRSVCILAVFEGRVITIEQYRHTLNRWMMELPCGGVEESEAPEESARRELLEETGYVAGKMVPLGCYYTNQGVSSADCEVFFTECTGYTASQTEETELIRVIPIPLKEFDELVRTNRFQMLIGMAAWNRAKWTGLL